MPYLRPSDSHMGNKFHIHAPFTSVHADMTLDNFPWTDPLMRIDTKN